MEGLANVPPELAANQQYEILRELGRGGMGVVYLARNKLMDRLEVLKVINKALLNHPGAVERFLREIRSAAKLSHANVVAAYSAVQQGELLAFAMEYVEGQDLANVVKSQGPLPVAHACFYIQQAALGLQHAFEKGMIHRDIKPQNLILAREGKKRTVKVLDFGLAKATREKTDDTGLTGEGKMLGTPDYVAPEQTLDAAKADIRADIYSLGCTLYYLLAGRPPFNANSLGAILLAHQTQEAKPLNSVRAEVPAELAAVVAKMMAKSPASRHQTPIEVVQVLTPFVKQGTTPNSAQEPSTDSAAAKLKSPGRTEPSPVQAKASSKQQTVPSGSGETQTSGKTVSARPQRAGVLSGSEAAPPKKARKGRLFLVALALGLPLLVVLGIWAGGFIDKSTKDGTTVQVDQKTEPSGTQTTSAGIKPTLATEKSTKSLTSEMRGVITKVSGKKVSFTEMKGKVEKGNEHTLTATKNVKVFKGKLNLKTKEIEAGDPVEGGLNNAMFSNIPQNGIRAMVITEDKKLTEIRLFGKQKKQ
ncbi:MAG TPA: serine/threonine-protein kinase [Gemmataceae bacterium]